MPSSLTSASLAFKIEKLFSRHDWYLECYLKMPKHGLHGILLSTRFWVSVKVTITNLEGLYHGNTCIDGESWRCTSIYNLKNNNNYDKVNKKPAKIIPWRFQRKTASLNWADGVAHHEYHEKMANHWRTWKTCSVFSE